MKEFFARLNPTERRFVVGVGVLFFLVANLVWVWPHFSDWGATKIRMNKAADNQATFQRGVDKIPGLKREIDKYLKEGIEVPTEDQAVQFVRLIQKQAAQSGVIIVNMGSQRQSGATNQFFVEQNETITLQSGEKQLVDFLYSLGAGNSLIRVKVLSVQPDQSHQQLTSRVTLIASYQKKAPAPRSAAPAAAAAPAAKQAAPAPISKPAVTNRAMTLPPPAPKILTPIKK